MELTSIVNWIISSSLTAGILIVLIAGIKFILQDRLNASWHYLIWFLLFVKLVIPFGPESPASLFNLMRLTKKNITQNTHKMQDLFYIRMSMTQNNSPVKIAKNTKSIPQRNITAANTIQSAPLPDKKISLRVGLIELIWLAGFVLISLYMIIMNIRCRMKIEAGRSFLPADRKIETILDSCRKELGISAKIGIIRTINIESPALYGIFKPKIIIPCDLEEELSASDIRYILLHELAHLKRMDTLINMIQSLFLALHWFNPLIWYAFYRMRSDAETACDAFVLSKIQPGKRRDFGLLIIGFLERYSGKFLIQSVVPNLLGGKAQMKRRLRMISIFKSFTKSLTLSALILVFLLGTVLLTSAVTAQNISFVDDPLIIGRWKFADKTANNAGFNPDRINWTGDYNGINFIAFSSGGKIPFTRWRWTKGCIIRPDNSEPLPYVIKNINGADYLFTGDLSGDDNNRIVYKRTDSTDYTEDNLPCKMDDMNVPFVNDRQIIGQWITIDYVKTTNNYQFGRSKESGHFKPYFYFFSRDGYTPSNSFRWTKGLILNKYMLTASRYEIKKTDGGEYMTAEFKGDDYIYFGCKPGFIILKKLNGINFTENNLPKRLDNIDLPFKDDPDIIGKWRIIDTIDETNNYIPGEDNWKPFMTLNNPINRSLYYWKSGKIIDTGIITNIYFCSKGNIMQWPSIYSYLRWVKGNILNPINSTAGKYEIIKRNNKEFMYLEWKNDDYNYYNAPPFYFVLMKEENKDYSL